MSLASDKREPVFVIITNQLHSLQKAVAVIASRRTNSNNSRHDKRLFLRLEIS